LWLVLWPLPGICLPPNAKPRFMRSLGKMRHEAERSIMADERKRWMMKFEQR